jgi:hypothetical protein
MSDRQEHIRFKVMPNGNIRAYQSDTYDKRGVSELQITNPRNESPTLTTENTIKIYLIYETG